MISREEGGDDVKSSWPLRAGLHTCYNGTYNKMQRGDSKPILKMYLSSDCTLQLECMKLELLVIVDQRATECVPGSCTHRPSHHGRWFYLKARVNTLDHGIVSDLGEVVTR